MEAKKKKLAVFDIDGTLFRSSLLIELVDGLVDSGVFPKSAKNEMENDYLSWLNRKEEYGKYCEQVVDIYLKNIKDCKESDVDETADKVVSWQKDRVYRFTRDLLRKLKANNYFLLAISGSPIDIVSKFAKQFGFDGVYGNLFEAKNGIFTGNVVGGDIVVRKGEVLKNFLKINEDLDQRDLIVVGDTDIDIPVLEMATLPIAFNPNKALADHAWLKKWVIILERKDMIYRLDQSRNPIRFI